MTWNRFVLTICFPVAVEQTLTETEEKLENVGRELTELRKCNKELQMSLRKNDASLKVHINHVWSQGYEVHNTFLHRRSRWRVIDCSWKSGNFSWRNKHWLKIWSECKIPNLLCVCVSVFLSVPPDSCQWNCLWMCRSVDWRESSKMSGEKEKSYKRYIILR